MNKKFLIPLLLLLVPIISGAQLTGTSDLIGSGSTTCPIGPNVLPPFTNVYSCSPSGCFVASPDLFVNDASRDALVQCTGAVGYEAYYVNSNTGGYTQDINIAAQSRSWLGQTTFTFGQNTNIPAPIYVLKFPNGSRFFAGFNFAAKYRTFTQQVTQRDQYDKDIQGVALMSACSSASCGGCGLTTADDNDKVCEQNVGCSATPSGAGGLVGDNACHSTTAARPVITSVTPTSITGGDTITIRGSGFSPKYNIVGITSVPASLSRGYLTGVPAGTGFLYQIDQSTNNGTTITLKYNVSSINPINIGEVYVVNQETGLVSNTLVVTPHSTTGGGTGGTGSGTIGTTGGSTINSTIANATTAINTAYSQLGLLTNILNSLLSGQPIDQNTLNAIQQSVTQIQSMLQQSYSTSINSLNTNIINQTGQTSNVSFPTTVTSNVDGLNVRSAPVLAGTVMSQLNQGQTFTAIGFVVGETVGGESKWWVTQNREYVWSGGTVEKP